MTEQPKIYQFLSGLDYATCFRSVRLTKPATLQPTTTQPAMHAIQ